MDIDVVRQHVWSRLAATGAIPAMVADTDLGEIVVLDVDTTMVTAHREKESAAATFKAGSATTNSGCV